MRRHAFAALAGLALALPLPAQQPARAPAPADSAGDTLGLTLGESLGRALGQSEEVRLARSQVELAATQVKAARAAALPQLNAQLAYTRTFASAFNTGGGLPDSLRFSPDTTVSLAERVRYLERNAPTAGLAGLGASFGSLPFGQENQYTVGLSGSQVLFSGGRTGAALEIARRYRSAAELTLREETAEIELQVRSAYTRALLAQELQGIARAALEQAEAFLRQEEVRRSAGRASDLEVLRAEVSRDNLRPQLVQATNAAELALLDLKRLLDVPLTRPVRLTTPLSASETALAAAPVATVDAEATAGRAALAAAAEQVGIREEQVRIARGAFLPSASLQVDYGRQLFPAQALDFGGDWRTNWTATVGVQVPIFSGFQRTAELQQARVELERSRLQLSQLRESVQLQYEQARGEREQARTAISARQTTVQAAQRVYDLTLLRYGQGLATQLDVSQARLEALQARTNLAQAVADFLIADARLARAAGGASGAS